MIFHPYKCFECEKDMSKGYPEDDEEPQFCSKECHDKYIEKHGKLPMGIKVNIKY